MARVFLFLQGPHGPFFGALGQALREAGQQVLRVGFNRGDEAFWPMAETYVPFRGKEAERRAFLAELMEDRGVTDIVVYSDTRPVHREAIQLANARGARVHCFEEGYLRPYWITYERDGTNGNSALMSRSMDQIAALVSGDDVAARPAPALWGNLWWHNLWGSAYHLYIWFRNGSYPHYRSHRNVTVRQEFLLKARAWLATPYRAFVHRLQTRSLLAASRPYHVVLLQLAHDANMRDHSQFTDMRSFVDFVLDGFAKGAPTHHQLVFKAHPLEDGREPIARMVADGAKARGLKDRVRFMPGGKLGQVLDHAKTAVTINSTAAQQALWRGLPVRVFGDAVFAKPEFVSDQPLDAFFARPRAPNVQLYLLYRHYLLRTCQVMGSFYSKAGRRAAVRGVIDAVLAEQDRFTTFECENATADGKLPVEQAPVLTLVGGSESMHPREAKNARTP